MVWATFEDVTGQPNALGRLTSWSNAEHAEQCATSPRTGSGAACSDSSWLTDASNKEWNLQISTEIGRGEKFYIYQAHRVTYDNSDMNWKWFRVWETEGDHPNFYIGTNGNSATVRNLTVEADGSPSMTKSVSVNTIYAHPGADSNWHVEEMMWQENSAAGVQDGNFTLTKDGVSGSTLTWSNDSTVNQGTPDHIFLQDDPSNGNPSTDKRAYRDDVYMDNSWSRIIVGNAATLAASTHREMCIPSAWADASASCYFHQGEFDASETAYFYICDGNNSCNADGYQVTVGFSQGVSVATESLRFTGFSRLSGFVFR
jgi:hypothetical protein